MLRGSLVLVLRVPWLARLTLPENSGGIGVSLGVRLDEGAKVSAGLDDPGAMYVRVRADLGSMYVRVRAVT